MTNAVYLATSGTDSVTATVAVTGGRSGVADDPARRRTHVASFVTDKVTGLSG